MSTHIQIGKIDKACSPEDLAKNQTFTSKSDALASFDSMALTPLCVSEDKVYYKTTQNWWFWSTAGLTLILLIVMLASIFKSRPPMIYQV
jgi:hypothetical protein